MFSISSFHFIVSRVVDPTRIAGDVSTVGFCAYECPGVAQFRALGQGCGL